MGACSFEVIYVAKTAQEAYNNAVEDAIFEDGHNPYNGTISTTDGFSMAKDAPRYGTKKFQEWESEKDEAMEKRSCLCVEVKGVKAKQYKTGRGMKVFYFFGVAAE